MAEKNVRQPNLHLKELSPSGLRENDVPLTLSRIALHQMNRFTLRRHAKDQVGGVRVLDASGLRLWLTPPTELTPIEGGFGSTESLGKSLRISLQVFCGRCRLPTG